MNIKGNEILEEIKSVISGKTLDAIFPPLIFIFSNNLMGLNRAVAFSLVIAFILATTRLIRKQNWKYALGGFLGVSIASGWAYLTKSAANYFIGSIVSSSLLFIVALVSLFIDKPIAAWASHLSRGWPLGWYLAS